MTDSDAGLRAGRPQARAARLHFAARIDDATDRRIARLLRSRGWTVRVEPYPSYGSTHWVRILARTVLAAPVVPDEELPSAGAAEAGGDGQGAPPRTLRGWRSFLAAPVAGARVEVRVGEAVHRLVTDRGGYLDHVIAVDLEPGWHEVTLRSQDGATTTAPVQVVDPRVRTGIVTDVDDTVMVTRLPRPLIAAWNSLVRHENAREAVPGMAGLFAQLLADEPGMPVLYLSTLAWNVAPTVGRFLRRHGYPPGTLLLTDWGPTNTGWLRSGRRHKVTQLHRLFTEFPDIRWVLIGDDGQFDPEIYAGAARRFGSHVRAILLRQLTFGEHVLSSGLLGPASTGTPTERGGDVADILVLQGADGYALRRQVDAVGACFGR